MALGSIVIDLLARTGSFTTDLKQAERRLKELEATAKKAGAIIGTAIVTGAGLAATAIRSQISAMDDMSKAALRAQMPTEQFSQLAHAANLSDVSLQDLSGSLGKLQRAQNDAADGTKAQVEAFERLGVSFANTDGTLRNTRDVFLDVADAFQKQQGTPEALASGMQIFGRSFQNLIPLLAGGREGLEAAADEADRLGITLSTEAGQQAEQFNDNITRLTTALNGLWQKLATDLLPELVELTDGFVSAASQGDTLKNVADGISGALRGMARAATVAYGSLGTLRAEMASAELVGRQFSPVDGVKSLINGGSYREPYEALARERARLAGESQRYQQQVRDALNPKAGGPVFAGDGNDPSGLFRRSEAQVAAERAQQAQAALAAAARKEAEAAAAASKAAGAAATAARNAEAEAARDRANAERELAEAIRESEKAERDLLQNMIEAEQVRMGWLRQVEDLTAQLDGPAAEAALRWGRAIAAADAALATGALNAQEHAKHVENLGREYEETLEKVNAKSSEMTVHAEQAARNMQDAFADFLFAPFDGGLKGMVSSFAEALRKMAAQAAASEIFKAIGNWAGGTGTGWGAALSGILNGTRANGGNVASGGTYLVGERGPELLRMGGQGGSIVPNHALGGGGVNVQIINNGPPVQAQTSRSQGPDGAEIIKLVLSAVAEDVGGGGMVAGAMKGRFGLREAM